MLETAFLPKFSTSRKRNSCVGAGLLCDSPVDYHESWYEVADASTAWLRQQQHFVDQREDLVRSACNLLNVGDPDQLLSTLFALVVETPDPAIAEEEAVLLREGWQRCFLNEPPYTAYYWNAETNHSTWRHPLETAQMERELQEKKEKRKLYLLRFFPCVFPLTAKQRHLPKYRCARSALYVKLSKLPV
ncbi:WW domain [Phytophthora cactorum]|nr:WW domain [Phytophthora cactorum]